MSQTHITRKESVWLACKEKTCCHNALVIPTGRDIWRIARALDVPPWTFLVYFQSQPRDDAFRLDGSERRFRVALSKQAANPKKPNAAPPCTFLVGTKQGFKRCGLGELRPQACKAFPSEAVAGVLCVQNETGCTCHRWSLADVDIREEMAVLDRRKEEFQEYGKVVSDWNHQVAAMPPNRTFSFFDYCKWLLAAYDEIEAGVYEVSGV